MKEQARLVVQALLGAANVAAPADALVMASACGLRLCPHRGGQRFTRGDELHFNALQPHDGQQRDVMNEVARWALRWYGADVTDEAAALVAELLLTGATPVHRAAAS